MILGLIDLAFDLVELVLDIYNPGNSSTHCCMLSAP